MKKYSKKYNLFVDSERNNEYCIGFTKGTI